MSLLDRPCLTIRVKITIIRDKEGRWWWWWCPACSPVFDTAISMSSLVTTKPPVPSPTANHRPSLAPAANQRAARVAREAAAAVVVSRCVERLERERAG